MATPQLPQGAAPAEDMVIIQIPKAQLDSVAEGLGMLTELIMGAQQKASADIAAQGGAANTAASDADMVAELEMMDKSSRG